ncbi:Pectinesterase [Bertholletia excelsa]
MMKELTVSIVSLIIVIGAVICTANDAPATNKIVDTICAPTKNKNMCTTKLNTVANNQSATVIDYIKAAFEATSEEVKKALDETFKVKVDNTSDPYNHMGVEDCKSLLQYAIDTLQAAISMVGDSEVHTIADRGYDLLNWISAVGAYQSICTEQLDKPEIKNPIQNGMIDATQLTSNAITIVAKLGEILPAFGIQLPNISINDIMKVNDGSRRLFEVSEVGHGDEYPEWFSAADRKLLMLTRMKPNAVVAKDGSGQYNTINGAIAAIPKDRVGRWIIYVKAGVYEEHVVIPDKVTDLYMYGDGPRKSIVTGSKSFKSGVNTMNTATFAVEGDRFLCKGMGFRNTAGPEGHQAVAFRSKSDLSACFNCRFDAYQDTLYYQTGRQFYRNCVIYGTVDFIFGKGTALIQNSQIIVRMGDSGQKNTVTADGKIQADSSGGLVIHKCKIVPDATLYANRFQFPSYLGRPWSPDAVTVVMSTEIGDFLHPDGWMLWDGTDRHQSCTYREYKNFGPGANPDARVKWAKVITDPKEAQRWSVAAHLEGGKEATAWVVHTGVPVDFSL